MNEKKNPIKMKKNMTENNCRKNNNNKNKLQIQRTNHKIQTPKTNCSKKHTHTQKKKQPCTKE